MTVKDIMRTPVVTIHQDATLRAAVALLSTHRVSGLPVVDDNDNLVGIATEHDIIQGILPTYENLLATDAALVDKRAIETRVYLVRDNPISSVMNKNVITLDEDMSLLKAASTVIMKKVKRLPVVRGRKPIGIVSRIDILEAVMHGDL